MSILFREIRRIISAVIICIAVIIAAVIWYKNGISIVESTQRIEQIPIHNEIHLLDEGCYADQIFKAGSDYLVGVDILLVNTSEESTGELVVQLLDMWGDVIAENRQALAQIESGAYQRVALNRELNLEDNEEFQIHIYAENANIIPGLISVSEDDDVEENTLCYYNGILTHRGLVLGYVFGHEKYTGYQYWERDKNQRDIATTIIVLFGSGILIYLIYAFRADKVKKILSDKNIYYQVTLISMLFSTFFLSAIINKAGTDVEIPVFIFIWLIGSALLLAITLFWHLKEIKPRYSVVGMKGRKRESDFAAIVSIVLFTIITRVPMFTVIQKWDSAIYYGSVKAACQSFDFTISSVWNGFKLAGHPTLAYTFFLGTGEFLFPARVTGVLLVNLVLTVAALICIYKMLRYYWSSMSAPYAAAAVWVLALIPVFWGNFAYVNVDYTLVIFFVFMLYAEYRKQNILLFFWMECVLLNKEAGWAVIVGYFCAYFFNLCKKVRGNAFKDKIKYFQKNPMIWAVMLGLVGICFYTVSQGSLFSWMGTGVEKSLFASWEDIQDQGLGINSIGIYPPYILHKFAQIFVLNFMWIPTLIIIICCAAAVKDKRKIKIHNLGGMLGGLSFFILFNIGFITAALNRYLVFSAVLIYLIALMLAYEIILPAVPRRAAGIAVGVSALLLCVQNFYYIDPLSNIIFDKLDSGKGIILSTDMNLNGYGDTLVNNYRYAYVDKLLDKMLAQAEYDQNTQVIELGEYDSFPIRGFGELYVLGWDTIHERRICKDTANTKTEIIPVNQVYLTEVENNEGEGTLPKAIVYFLTYFDYDEASYLKRLETYYNIGERREISNWGGTLSYYILERKG